MVLVIDQDGCAYDLVREANLYGPYEDAPLAYQFLASLSRGWSRVQPYSLARTPTAFPSASKAASAIVIASVCN